MSILTWISSYTAGPRQVGTVNKDTACAPFCRRCNHAMELVSTIPKLGGLPELNVYRCAECAAVKTIELVLH